MKFLNYAALLGSFVAPSAFAAAPNCARQTQNGQHVMVCTGTSDQHKQMTLTFPGDRITMQSDTAVFCSTPNAAIDTAVVWMDMGGSGHTSGPTTLTADGVCTKIDDIEFLMNGTWQIKVHFPDANGNNSDDDKGIVNVSVTH